MFIDCTITGAHAIRGGCLLLRGGNTTLIGCTLTNLTALKNLVSAEDITSDSRGWYFVDYYSGTDEWRQENDGGFADVLFSSRNLVSSLTVHSTRLSHVRAVRGGLIYASGFRMEFNNCSIHDAQADIGGAFYMDGGKLTVSNSSSISHAVALQAGGAFHMTSGAVYLTQVSIVEADAPQGAVLMYPVFLLSCFSASLKSVPGTFVCTHVIIKQRACNSVLQLDDPLNLVLRNVSFQQLPGCNATRLALDAFGGTVEESTKDCGSVYVDASNVDTQVSSTSAGVCAPFAKCVMRPVDGTPLRDWTCECAAPDLPSPEFDPLLAPYRATDGCIQPRALEDVFSVMRDVEVLLVKPAVRVVNLTLYMRGSDAKRPARWRVLNAAGLPPWLQLPRGSGLAEGDTPNVELVLNASGLREDAAPRLQTLLIHVAASIQDGEESVGLISALAAAARTVSVDVSLSVQATVGFAVWGHVSDGSCDGLSAEAIVNNTATAGELRRVPFTVCAASLQRGPWRPKLSCSVSSALRVCTR